MGSDVAVGMWAVTWGGASSSFSGDVVVMMVVLRVEQGGDMVVVGRWQLTGGGSEWGAGCGW